MWVMMKIQRYSIEVDSTGLIKPTSHHISLTAVENILKKGWNINPIHVVIVVWCSTKRSKVWFGCNTTFNLLFFNAAFINTADSTVKRHCHFYVQTWSGWTLNISSWTGWTGWTGCWICLGRLNFTSLVYRTTILVRSSPWVCSTTNENESKVFQGYSCLCGGPCVMCMLCGWTHSDSGLTLNWVFSTLATGDGTLLYF